MRRLAVKIFLVEDDFALAKLVKEAIKKYNFEVFPSTNFQALDQEFLEVQHDLVLMDINLPYFDGFYWTKQIRQHTNVPIWATLEILIYRIGLVKMKGENYNNTSWQSRHIL